MANHKFDKEFPLFLKKMGLSNPDIAEIIGASKVWVSSNFTGVKSDLEMQECYMKKAYEIYKAEIEGLPDTGVGDEVSQDD